MKVLFNDYPQRSVALSSASHTLIFSYAAAARSNGDTASTLSSSIPSRVSGTRSNHRCAVEFSASNHLNLEDYAVLSNSPCLGCLGLINIGVDTFLCIITGAKEVAQVRPGEMVYRIYGVEFHCLNRTDYDYFQESEVNANPVDPDGWDQSRSQQQAAAEHPCLALKKLLSDGTFYYSGDFDLTNRLQDRSIDLDEFNIDSFDIGFMWNSHMISPLLHFRSHLSIKEQATLDHTRFLTCVIRGFVESMTTQRPTTLMNSRSRVTGLPAILTLISRLSCRRAGTRFNARGIDDDGNVANFVETETVVWNPGSGLSSRPTGFSYCQIRGSIPIFWEQQTGLLPNQQKISITRSPEATQPAFDRHMDGLVLKYGAAHIVNLLSESKSGEVELSSRYRKHIRHSALLADDPNHNSKTRPSLLRNTEYDFHAETKGPAGYEAASQIRHIVSESADAFGYFLMEGSSRADNEPRNDPLTVLHQGGVFRTNCLDCLDRTNLVQGILSKMAIEALLAYRTEVVGHDFWMRHSTLWADNGDALSKIYAGTGALKSSFTRTGKMSLAGAIADARKSATRMYINNFADKDRQNTIDVLLGRLVGQEPVGLYDPTNEYVSTELNKRSSEFTTEIPIHIYTGTFNLNGQTGGIEHDLSGWLRPSFVDKQEHPELVVVGFQEIVELSPQQIMATDPARRKLWERALLKCLNSSTEDPYILLRGGQLVGAALLIFVRSSVIGEIKNVEGSLKKTGMSGVAGNKGAVAIRFEYANTRLCFVTAHLAAGFSNSDERNKDYLTIANGLRFQRGRKIEDHDSVIWLGDFNYRIGLPDERVRKLIDIGDLQTLYDNDQLHLQMVAGLTFPYYTEARLTFEPTYKYDIGTDCYDTSEKSRIPAWCDRVLWKGQGLRQLSYGCADIRFSDHRPVFATFQCMVSLVNEVIKAELSRKLYLKRKADFKSFKYSNSVLDDGHRDGDLLGLGSLAPGLPVPSSDKQKWWLNDGLPAKSTIKALPNTVLNPDRPFNPFTETRESDWVDFSSLSHSVDLEHSTYQKPADMMTNKSARKLPPPYNAAILPPIAPRAGPTRKSVPQSSTTTSNKSASSSKTNIKPTIPQKPFELLSFQNRDLSVEIVGVNNDPDSAAPVSQNVASSHDKYLPRRTGTFDIYSSTNLHSHQPPRKPAPVLPPRLSPPDLMDTQADTPQLNSWQPLKPT